MGNTLRILIKIGVIIALLALAILACPISIVQAQESKPLVFEIDPTLGQPREVLRPYLSEFQVKQPKVKKPVIGKSLAKTQDFDHCNCVSYVKHKTGVNITGIGTAKNWPVNSQVCQIGAIIVTYESKAGHVGVVAGCNGINVTIDDYNYIHCGHSIRTLALTNKVIKGYYIYG